MKCQKCGYEIKDISKPCQKCGFKDSKNKEVDDLIKNMLEEESYEPKFKTTSKTNDSNSVKGSAITKGSKKGSKKDKPSVRNSNEPKKKTTGDRMILITKYMILLSIMAFVASIFFGWFQLSGATANIGAVRTTETEKMMTKPLRDIVLDGSDDYDGTVIAFTGYDLFTYAKESSDIHGYITGVDGDPKSSIVSKAQSFYMLGILVVIGLCLLSGFILMIFKKYTGVPTVRNIAVINFIIVGLNYMALKVPYFSMIAIRAKDILSQSIVHPSIKMSMSGISMNQVFFPYELELMTGFYVAVIALTVWLVLSVVLSEVRNREQEIAIENGELD